MFEPFALARVDRLTGIQGDTRSKYKKEITIKSASARP